ncbi:hypothetical protein JG687_00017004, partial [Phytophthora cactorum]
MQSENIYSDYTCTSVPISMSIVEASSCVSSSCAVTYIGTEYYYTETTCPSDAKSYAASTYGSTKYLLVDVHTDIDCSSYSGTAVIIASGTCEVIGTTGQGIITNVFSNGSAQFQYFMDSTCTYASSSPYVISKDLLTSHACFQGFKLYSNSDGSTTSGASQTSDTDGTSGTTGSGSGDSSGVSIGVIIGIAAGVVILLLIVGIICWRCRRNRNKQEEPLHQVQSPGAFEQAVASSAQFHRMPITPQKTATASTTLASSDGALPSKLWDDEAIVAARIPREKISTEVYSDSSCESPVTLTIISSASCLSSDCASTTIAGSTYYTETSCPSSIYSHAADVYDNTEYLLVDFYSGTDCTTYVESVAFATSGECQIAGTDGQSVVATLYSNGSAQLTYYLDGTCTLSASASYSITEDDLTSHSCSSGRKYYSSSDGSATNGVSSSSSTSSSSSDGSSGIGSGAIAGIIVGVLFALTNDLRDAAYEAQVSPAKPHRQTTITTASDFDRRHSAKLWDDDVIVAARIPREK